MALLLRLKLLMRAFGRNGLVLLYAIRRPGVPAWIRLATLLMVIYVLSPVDLVSDLLPVLGWADDLVMLSFGIPWLLSKLPESVRSDAEQRAATTRWAKWFGA